MKKNFIYYGIIWLIAIAVFNVIVFVAPTEKVGVFWAGYVLITVMFVIQIVCSYFFFKEDKSDKVFLNIPIMVISYSALIAAFSFGTLFMAAPALPEWIAIIVCAVITGFYVIAIISEKATSDIIGQTDKKIKTQTFFIRSLTVDAQSLTAKANTQEVRKMAEDVYEAIRYSDPMSNDALATAESAITIKFKEFEEAVINNADDTSRISNELLILINDRNQKCKLLK